MQRINPLPVGKLSRDERTVMSKKANGIVMSVFVILIALGIITGYLLAGGSSGQKPNGTAATASAGPSAGGKAFGSADTKTFSDSAIGTVEKDGIGGEGTHKLVRDGGPTQTACLVSSVLDLDNFVGKKVKINGKTMDAKKCPWFMDVGRIELQ